MVSCNEKEWDSPVSEERAQKSEGREKRRTERKKKGQLGRALEPKGRVEKREGMVQREDEEDSDRIGDDGIGTETEKQS